MHCIILFTVSKCSYVISNVNDFLNYRVASCESRKT